MIELLVYVVVFWVAVPALFLGIGKMVIGVTADKTIGRSASRSTRVGKGSFASGD